MSEAEPNFGRYADKPYQIEDKDVLATPDIAPPPVAKIAPPRPTAKIEVPPTAKIAPPMAKVAPVAGKLMKEIPMAKVLPPPVGKLVSVKKSGK